MNGLGLLLFIVAKILMVIIYPFGFTYSVLLTFFKFSITYFKEDKTTRFANYLYYPKFIILLYSIGKSILHGLQAVDKKLYYCAYADDQHANVYNSKILNDLLVKPGGPKFGDPDEPISSVLGKGYIMGKLRLLGIGIDKGLEKLDKNHSVKSIEINERNN